MVIGLCILLSLMRKMQGVLMLMGIYDTSWATMRSFLSKREVKDEIITFDVRKINKDSRYVTLSILL